MKNILTHTVWMIILLSSCDITTTNKINTQKIKEGLKDREIKRVTESTLFDIAKEKGREVADLSQSILSDQLMKSIQSQGVSQSLEFCNLSASTMLDSIMDAYNVEIKRTSLKTRNIHNEANGIEKQILEAYAYSLGQGEKVGDNIQSVEEGNYLLYTKPIIINNGLCLNCHGSKEGEVTENTKILINKLYPEDKAHGYAIGDLRGMWSIKISRKSIVQSLPSYR